MFTNHIWLRGDGKIHRIPISSIQYISADKGYCYIHTQQRTCQVTISMLVLLQKLRGYRFYRVHRKYIVNGHLITSLSKNVISLGNISLPMTKSYAEPLFEKFSTIKMTRPRKAS